VVILPRTSTDTTDGMSRTGIVVGPYAAQLDDARATGGSVRDFVPALGPRCDRRVVCPRSSASSPGSGRPNSGAFAAQDLTGVGRADRILRCETVSVRGPA
jgi:hypothetical protein